MSGLKLEDLIEGKKYKISKPTDTEEYPYWNEGEMDTIKEEVFTYFKSDCKSYEVHEEEDCIWYGGCVIKPSWLTLVEGTDFLNVEWVNPEIVEEPKQFTAVSEESIEGKKHNHYFKHCPYEYIDIYRLIKMWEITDPCIQHAFKKLAVTGGRGHKSIEHDVQDVIDTLVRWQEMNKEDKD